MNQKEYDEVCERNGQHIVHAENYLFRVEQDAKCYILPLIKGLLKPSFCSPFQYSEEQAKRYEDCAATIWECWHKTIHPMLQEIQQIQERIK